MSKSWKYFIAFLFSTLLLALLANISLLNSKLHLVFCDVGQGDGILIYQKSVQIVVDAGPGNAYLKCLSEHMPFWDRKIELVVLTNPDRDHYGSMIEIFRRYKVESFISPGIEKEDASFIVLEHEAAREKATISSLVAGQDIKIGEIALQTLWPTKDWVVQQTVPQYPSAESVVLGAFLPAKPESVNQTSLVFKLSFGEFDALLTGDVAPPATDMLALSEHQRVEWEVLKVPHHGSKNGLTESMVKSTNPKLAIISSGKNNRYGHPHQETLKLLEGIKTLRTDLDGEIEIVTDGKTWQLSE